ncbi:MAG: peptidoglycan DD-metalloendopeptidase family protein [Alphaproteobacteria bacterium]|nr:peptidoglycan DD-metalloendopeptidase family protein [Alphaproteobacteria bacterium]
MIKYLSILLLSIALIIHSAPAPAQPIPQNKKEALGDLDQKLKDITAEKKALEKDAGKAQATYEKTKKDLIKTSASVQKNQSDMLALETRLKDLRDDQTRIKAELAEEREALAQTIVALQRLEKTPPQAMMARPGAPIDTARGAMLLQQILPVLHQKAEALKKKSETYAANEAELKAKQKTLVAVSADLSKKEKTLKTLVTERKEQYAMLNKNLAQRKKDIEKVSKDAKNLSDLVKRLEDERTRNAKLQRESNNNRPVKQAALPKLGQSQLPLRGNIRVKYHENDEFGGKSQGVSIEGRGGALIVSPMGGIVRFAGYFKNYGNMVIIEHENGYHSLIAGLEKIDTVVDQSVSAGEPLGNLYNSKNGKPPTLYFELRHKGKSINPALKFTELG